jgi:hypothetical protein
MDAYEEVRIMKSVFCRFSFIAFLSAALAFSASAADAKITNTSDNKADYPSSAVPMYEKFEVSFDVEGLAAKNVYMPYDGESIPGLAPKVGVTIDGLFLEPGNSDWGKAIVQPAFLYQPMLADAERGFTYPVGKSVWKVRFAPEKKGDWKYRIRVQDAGVCGNQWPSDKWVESAEGNFKVTDAQKDNHGFVQVSPNDSRYWQFTDGSQYLGVGHEVNVESFIVDLPNCEPYFEQLEKYGIDFIRTWMCSSLVIGRGTHGWDPWRNVERVGANDGIAGVPYDYHDIAVRISGDGKFIFAMQDGSQPLGPWLEAEKNYVVRVRAKLDNVESSGAEPSGLVFKLIRRGGNFAAADNTVTLITPEGFKGSTDWKIFEGRFANSRRRPLAQEGTLAIGLQNVSGGDVYIDDIYLGEDLGDGKVGPNVLFKGEMNYHLYCDQIASYLYDEYFEKAKKHGVYVKAVILEKNDPIYDNISLEDGKFSNGRGNNNNFYAKEGTKVRRLHEYFWRYVAARWGYCTGVHSWELLNEGDPGNGMHYDQANALQRAIDKWDRNHMANTSFWHSFPARFWKESDCDYADLHAYVSTSRAPKEIKPQMQVDAAFYHIWHSEDVYKKKVGKPVVRGEAGLDFPGNQMQNPELRKDTEGVWFHNYVWAMLCSGGMYELYWWTEDLYNYDPRRGNEFDHRDEFVRYRAFMAGIDLHKGGYEDWAGTVDNDNVRVVGQKNTAKGVFHLWMQNTKHTWKNVVDGVSIEPLEAKVTVPGFNAGKVLKLEWWDTYTGKPVRTEMVQAGANGDVVLNVSGLATDTAVKVIKD